MNFSFIKILILFFACCMNFNTWSQQKEFGWLLGTWQLKDKQVFEHWSLDHDNQTIHGISYRIKNTADTVVTEEITLKLEQGAFYYVPDVIGNQGPVAFRITQYDKTMFVAENMKHDFPKIIRYKLVRKDNHDINEASIEGNGKVISYTFVRLN
ncbi:hypothetical protein [Ohtaekwangia sp.]|uniref:hypothetical protein n=1 Tax=Ohtaekwangia sp. TaxID=2066019 RepID=UPI002FDE4CAF